VTQQSKTLPAFDLEVEAVDGNDVAICFAKSLDPQRGSGQ
jgi:hypothetical protein